ncbi:hypothetical protein [Falsirhodobacter deserti]|uniref:hypothetical protein n=1 Tax=Falsirhodobacter deserti TaxID=1365611 RepID=UPI000FE2B1BC|nr:hypothetical protein [Falsirhodobacter deserti]
MKNVLAAALCVAASGAWGQAVTVHTGEHKGFTRLAMVLPSQQGWRLGRTDEGYALALDKPVDLNLSGVWRRIGKQRINGLSHDQGSSMLRVALACSACHATAFEMEPGLIVVDIRDGDAPEGSRFEARLVADRPRPRQPEPKQRDVVALPTSRPERGYDWTTLPRNPDVAPPPPALDAFRDAVLRQLADGAARGVVDMVESLPPAPEMTALPPQMRVQQEPGFVPDPKQPLTAEGRICIPAERLDLASWGTEAPVSEALGLARSGLEGEFDVPDTEAVDRAVRYYLHLGFGAEARQLAQAYSLPAEDRRLYSALSRILDGEPVPGGLLAPMADCDGPAALWALLALPAPRPGQPENAGAALQAFTALPQHLRRTLAPLLLERLERRKDTESIRIVQDALLRADPDPDPETRLLVARQATDGEADLAALAAEGGRGSADATVALADRRLSAGTPIDAPTLVALQALAQERDSAALRRLVVLGLASTGDFEAAFREVAHARSAADELWGWLATTGDDNTLLRHAVLPKDAPHPALPLATRIALADRLTDIGLPELAVRWLGDAATLPDATEAERLAAARAAVADRNAPEVVRLLAGLTGKDADALRARADAQPKRAPSPSEAWAQTQELLTVDHPEEGPLGHGRTLAAQAGDTRARIEALLTGTQVQR